MSQATVTKFHLTQAVAQKRIHETALTTSNIILGKHAKERMVERDISISDVYRVLRSGSVEGNPDLTEKGEWKCKIVMPLRGRRVAGVITVILHSGRLFVKTVEWEDLR